MLIIGRLRCFGNFRTYDGLATMLGRLQCGSCRCHHVASSSSGPARVSPATRPGLLEAAASIDAQNIGSRSAVAASNNVERPRTSHTDQTTAGELAAFFQKLVLERTSGQLVSPPGVAPTLTPTDYKLPTLSHNILNKRTILDPVTNPKTYELPCFTSIVKEKVAPTFEHIVPIEDPSPLQKIIDQGTPVLEKFAMPYLMRIRHRKMKKHKLKKLRKRMLMYNKTLQEAKKKKKEKLMEEYAESWMKTAGEYDPEKFVDDNLAMARKGGLGLGLKLPTPPLRPPLIEDP